MPFAVGELMQMHPSSRPKRILVAEDNLALLDHFRFTLAKAGLDVVAVGNGEQALAAMNQGEFDLIVADADLPTFSTLEPPGDVVNRASRASVPMLRLTASVPGCDLPTALGNTGQIASLRKPFGPRDLVCQVLAQLGCLSPD